VAADDQHGTRAADRRGPLDRMRHERAAAPRREQLAAAEPAAGTRRQDDGEQVPGRHECLPSAERTGSVVREPARRNDPRGEKRRSALAPAADSRYLCRAGRTRESALHVIKSLEDAKALEGREVGLSDWIEIDQARIDKF